MISSRSTLLTELLLRRTWTLIAPLRVSHRYSLMSYIFQLVDWNQNRVSLSLLLCSFRLGLLLKDFFDNFPDFHLGHDRSVCQVLKLFLMALHEFFKHSLMLLFQLLSC